MRKVINFLQDVIKQCNVFTAPVNLRYKLDPDYNTVMGGFVSISMLVLLVGVFYNAWLQLLNREAISSSTELVREFDPLSMEVNTDDFMFAIGISGLNLSDTSQKQFFSIKMRLFTVINAPAYSKVATTLNLQPCTLHHWEQLGDDFATTYQSQGLSAFLCPPRNTTLQVGGKFTSTIFQYYKIEVNKCTTNCRTQAQLDAWTLANSTFSFNFYYVNTLINPDQTQPLSTFFEDKDYIVFSTSLYTTSNMYIGGYSMQTDQSIFPWSDSKIDEGFIVNRQQKQVQNFMASTFDPYCRLHIRKSNKKFDITRSFRKIDDMLSYIGGLFGIIAAALGFVMNYYNRCSYELEMSQNFFDYHNKKFSKDKMNQNFSDSNLPGKPHGQSFEGNSNKADTEGLAEKSQLQPDKVIEPKQFGFIDFLLHIIYVPLNKICNFQWKRMNIYSESLEEIKYKLDVSLLLEKLAFYDRSFNVLFDQNQLKLLYLQEKYNFEQVREERELLGMKHDIIANIFELALQDNIGNREQVVERKKTLNQMKSRKRNSTFMGNSPNFFDIMAQLPNKQNKDSDPQLNLPDDIKKALKKLDEKIQKGDPVSIRIYNNLQYQILEAFQKSKLKRTKHRVTNFKSPSRRIRQVDLAKMQRKQRQNIQALNLGEEGSSTSIVKLPLR